MAIAPKITELINTESSDCAALQDSFQRDFDTVVAVLRLLLSRDNISSEMTDNTNGLIVMRSYLTTLFYVDKVVLPAQTGSTA